MTGGADRPRSTRLVVGTWPTDGTVGRLQHLTSGGGDRFCAQFLLEGTALALADDPVRRTVYIGEVDGVRAARWSTDGLVPHGDSHRSIGTVACHLALSADRRHLLVAHYLSGTVVVHPLSADGAILPATDRIQLEGQGPDPDRQDGSHPHMIVCGTDDEVLVADLGADMLWRLGLDAGRLTHRGGIPLPPGTGPRHLAVVDGTAFVVGELSGALVAVDLREGVVLHAEPCSGPGSTLSGPSHPSAVVVRRTGTEALAYVLVRGADTVAVFRLGRRPQLVDVVPSGGRDPWDAVAIDDILYVAHRSGGGVTALDLDPVSGQPISPPRAVAAVDAAACLVSR